MTTKQELCTDSSGSAGAPDLDLTGCVIAHRNDRMGGRLIAMINAMRIADTLGLPFRVGWTTHGRTSDEIRTPSDIFAECFIADHFFGGEPLAQIWAELVNLATLEDTSAHAVTAAAAQGTSFLSEAAIGSIVLPWENPETVKADLPRFFNNIAFSADVDAAMRNIDATFAGLSLRAYHIRRGDIISDPITSEKLWPNKYIPREFYEIHIRQFLASGGDRCIVFSDTPAEIDRLKTIDERIICFDDIVPHEGLKAGQRDILELYSMSKCPLIYGPPESAFSQTAATIGGGTVFAVQSSLSESEQAAAMDLMSSRMAKPERYFLGDGDVGQNFPFLITHYESKGRPDTAREIILGLVEGGFSRSYAYSQLCRLAMTCNDIGSVHDLLKIAKRRPILTEAAMADVYVFAAIAHYQNGDAAAARHSIHAAYWLSPLDKVVTGILNLMLSAGWLDDHNMYPHDARLVRNKGRLFPQQNPLLDVFNAIEQPDGQTGKLQFYPWDLAVRDWRFVHGKKLNRAFWHKGKMRNEMDRLIRSSSKIAGSAQLHSAVSIYLRYMENFDAALGENRNAEAQHPYDPLYAKRSADILLEAGQIDDGLIQVARATELSGDNPYYLAHLGYWSGKAKQPDLAYETFSKLANISHDCVEIKLLTSEFLRRRPKTRERALELVSEATEDAHGSMRLLISKARLLLTMEQIAPAADIYRAIAHTRIAQANVFAQMYRTLEKIGQEDLAISIIGESQFSTEDVTALLES